MTVGLISDTHGLLRPGVIDAFTGVDLILHAGDVGGRGVIDGLSAVAPTRAVCGNVDPPDGTLVASIGCELEGLRIHLSHGHETGSPTPARLAARYDADVIIYGHTHRALIEWVGRVLIINPGAAGPGRFRLRPSVALLSLPARQAQLVYL